MLTLNEKLIRFLSAIKECKSTASQTRVVRKLWGHHYKVEWLKALLALTEMAGAVCVTKFQRRGKRGQRALGRPEIRFKLTRRGHVLLKRLVRAQEVERAALALARDLDAQARAARRQARADARIKKDAAIAQRAIVEASRQAAIAAAGLSKGAALPETSRAPYIAPRMPVALPRPYPGPSPTPPAGFNRPAPPMATTPIGERSSLIDRIKAARFRVNDRSEVLFDGRWVSVDEWMRRNGSVLNR